ncbi:MAG: hypothetical protein AAGE52_17195 [Myxococcota bacterium]
MADDPTFVYRVVFGVLLLGALGARDWIKHPENPARLKEYVFLFSVTALTMLYGLAHDAITFFISPTYFRLFKGIPATSFFPDVARLALMASWTAGLAIGLVLLIANNPSAKYPQLSYRRLSALLLWPLAGALVFAVVGGSFGPLFLELPWDAGPRPTRVWGIHLGTYVGATLGVGLAAAHIRRVRSANGSSQGLRRGGRRPHGFGDW